MSERKLVPQSGQRSKPSRSLANRLQPITPSQRIGLFNSERIRCAHGPASTKTNYHGKTLIADGTANGGTSRSCKESPTGRSSKMLESFQLPPPASVEN